MRARRAPSSCSRRSCSSSPRGSSAPSSRRRSRSTSSRRSSRSRSSSRSTSSSGTPACSRSATSASSPSASGRRACSRSPRARSRRRCPTSSTSSPRRPSETSRRSSSPRSWQACSRFWSASRSCASRASPRASRRSPCSGSPTTSSGTTRRSGPGLNTFSSVPETTDLLQATVGAVLVIVAAFAYQRSRLGRQLRATREDPAAARAVGVSIYRQRLGAFALSGFLAGFAGGLYVHFLPINVDAVYLDLTFITLAMLVIGGTTSLWGAVVGALVRERARLVPRGGGDGRRDPRSRDRSPRRHADRRRERAHGARPHPATERADGRARVLAPATASRRDAK